MKKFLSLLLIIITTYTVSFAQDSTSAKAKAKHAKAKQGVAKQNKISKLKQLNITADQQAKINESKKNYRAESQKIKKDSTISEAQRKTKLKQLQKDERKRIDAVLTAEQKNKMKEMHKKPKANSPQNSKPSPKTPGTAKR